MSVRSRMINLEGLEISETGAVYKDPNKVVNSERAKRDRAVIRRNIREWMKVKNEEDYVMTEQDTLIITKDPTDV